MYELQSIYSGNVAYKPLSIDRDPRIANICHINNRNNDPFCV